MGASISSCCPCDSSATLNLYVSGINGNDNNSGYTPSTPLATVTEAVRRALTAVGLVFIHIGAQGGAGYTPPTVVQQAKYANYYFIGDGAGQPGEDGFTVVLPTEAAIAASTINIIKTTSVLVTNAYRGMTVEIMSGSAIGNRRTIAFNDTATLYPTVPFTAAIAINDTFRIVDPTVVWNFPAATVQDFQLLVGCGQPEGTIILQYAPAVYFVNMRWTGPSSAAVYSIINSRAIFFGIVSTTVASNASIPQPQWQAFSEIGLGEDNTALGVFNSGNGSFGPFIDGLCASKTAWRGWSYAQRGTGTTALVIAGEVHGSFVGFGLNASSPTSDLALTGGNIYGNPTAGSIQASNGGRIRISSANTTVIPLRISSTAAGGAIVIQRGGNLFTLTGALISATAGPALYAYGDGKIQVVSLVDTTGSVVGARCDLGGLIDFAAAPTTIVGSTSDFNMDGIAMANATISAVGDYTVNTPGSKIMRSA